MSVVVLVGEAVDLLVVVGLGFVVVAPAVVVAAVDVVESVVDADVVHVKLLLAVVVPVVWKLLLTLMLLLLPFICCLHLVTDLSLAARLMFQSFSHLSHCLLPLYLHSSLPKLFD